MLLTVLQLDPRIHEGMRLVCVSSTFMPSVVQGLTGPRIVKSHEKAGANINRRFFPHESRLCCAASPVQVFGLDLSPVLRAARLSWQQPTTPPVLEHFFP